MPVYGFFPGLQPVGSYTPNSKQPAYAQNVRLLATQDGIPFLPPADVLVVLAHPDDEILLSGSLMRLQERGYRVQLVYATAGEGGKNLVGPAQGEALAGIRKGETRQALDALGLDRPPCFLGFPDGHVPEHRRDLEDALTRVLEQTRPGLILTFGPDGFTGHRDHIGIERMTDAVASRMDYGDRVYHLGFSPDSLSVFQRVFRRTGSDAWDAVQAVPAEEVRVRVDIEELVPRKLGGIARHRTQFSPRELAAFQAYHQINPYEEFTRLADRR